MQESISFYTNVLDFQIKESALALDTQVIELVRDYSEIQLSILDGDGVFGSAINIVVDDVDRLFRNFRERGLDTSPKKDSPVHQGPVDQTWGIREFYVTDPNGNTLRFGTPLPNPKPQT